MPTVVDLTLGPGPYSPPPARNVVLVLGGVTPGGPGGPGGPMLHGLPTCMPWGRISLVAAGSALAPWGRVDDALAGQSAAAYGRASPLHSAPTRAPWGRLDSALERRLLAPWSEPLPARSWTRMPWGAALPLWRKSVAPWANARPLRTPLLASWDAAGRRRHAAAAPWAAAGRSIRMLRAPWGAGLLLIGPNVERPIVPVVGFDLPRGTRVDLTLCARGWDTDLVLGLPPCPPRPRALRGTIAPAATYMITHSLQFHRLPDLLALHAYQWSLAADSDSFGWTLQFTGPAQLLTQLAPVGSTPAQVRLRIDGLEWHFVVQRLRRNREFGSTSCTVTARSGGVLLGEPFYGTRSWINAVPMTAQQLAAEALDLTGVGLDWRITDWLVPTGAWSYTGTPLAAVRRIADAAGAVLASSRTGQTLIVAPRYPVLPWAWAAATPDVVIALDSVELEGMEDDDRPPAEGVYISGQYQGVLALVKRTGTGPAADKMLPMVTDALITDLDAALQRGVSLLGAAGRRATMTLSVPVLTGPGEPGVIDPQELVEVPDPAGAWRGLVRAVSVSGDGFDLMQTLTVERHL